MNINRNNYESYFVDYLEGNLDEKLVDDFIEFLQQNPELKKELSLFDFISIVPENVEFRKKDKLYKEKYDAEKAFNQAAIERLEGEISEKENKNFREYLAKHPEKEKEAALFNDTKLKPDESVVFNKKRKLYRRPIGKTVLLWSVRAAAVFVFAFLLYVLTNQPASYLVPENQVASVEKKDTKKEVQPVVEEKTGTKETPARQNKKKEQTKTTTPVIKKPAPKPKETKNLRETTKGRMEGENLALHRIPEDVPEKMNRIITVPLNNNMPAATLSAMRLKMIEEPPVYEERFLTDAIKEKTGIDKLSFDKIKKAGLNFVSTITKDNLSYETNEEGRITEINYDSRLLAFSIPTNSEEAGE
jgi:hypothetical protein